MQCYQIILQRHEGFIVVTFKTWIYQQMESYSLAFFNMSCKVYSLTKTDLEEQQCQSNITGMQAMKLPFLLFQVVE